jgi:hypothetical protein
MSLAGRCAAALSIDQYDAPLLAQVIERRPLAAATTPRGKQLSELIPWPVVWSSHASHRFTCGWSNRGDDFCRNRWRLLRSFSTAGADRIVRRHAHVSPFDGPNRADPVRLR